jgi:simple sugar transport system ATP-binding protein
MRVELKKINKSFGPVHANADITMTLEPGHIYGILGENGAGKSTLMKILSGYQGADNGDIVLDGAVQAFRSPADALAAGVGMLYQEPLDMPPFTVYENFLLGKKGRLQIDSRAVAAEMLALGKRYGFEIQPEERIADLSLGERQQLELLRLLAGGASVLILDEPTTGISAEQKELLFASMRTLAEKENKTLILVSHKLDEVQELCDHAFVLRKGILVGGTELPCSNQTLVGMMFEQLPPRRERPAAQMKQTILEIQDLVVVTPRLELQPLNLKVYAGETFGLAGLEGSGQELLLKAVAGLLPIKQGRILINGENLGHLNYHKARRKGVAYVAAGRLEEGLVAGLTLTEHMALVDEQPRFFVDWDGNRQRSATRIQDYQVVGTPESQVEQLSGGNQQRFLFALLHSSLKVILLEHPTRGLDLRSTDWIWQQMDERRKSGTAILFISADLEEIIERSDRIAVFSAGRMSRIVDASKTSVDELGHLIGGQQ